MHLDNDTFRTVVASTPLVSIDLIVKNAEGQVLLGKRNNRPAQSMWFVPGGRILKNEPISTAFKRLVKNELNADADLSEAQFLGLYDHLYPDSIWGDDVTTHYVVNAFEMQRVFDGSALPSDQHNEYVWFDIETLLSAPDVHDHTKWYFTKGKGYS